MAPGLLLAMASLNALLILFILVSNLDRVVSLLYRISAFLAPILRTSTLLFVYGLLLVYLLLSVRHLGARLNQRKPMPRPLLDANDKLKGYYNDGNSRTTPANDMVQQTGRGRRRRSHDSAHDSAPHPFPEPMSRVSREQTPDLPRAATPVTPEVVQPAAWSGWVNGHIECLFYWKDMGNNESVPYFWWGRKSTGRRGSKNARTAAKGRKPFTNAWVLFAARHLLAHTTTPFGQQIPQRCGKSSSLYDARVDFASNTQSAESNAQHPCIEMVSLCETAVCIPTCNSHTNSMFQPRESRNSVHTTIPGMFHPFAPVQRWKVSFPLLSFKSLTASKFLYSQKTPRRCHR
ncbi:hypothetical protein C8F01DRAFT_1121843 [Mycena amicta]|nr:hypothetical protein C8F01DRAFT_1121843 [Mycena amicta]